MATRENTVCKKLINRLSSAVCITAAAVFVSLTFLCGCTDNGSAGESSADQTSFVQTVSSPDIPAESRQDTTTSQTAKRDLDAVSIKLSFGDNTETIDKQVFSQWTTESGTDGELSFDEPALRSFVRSLAKKYNTFRDDIAFTDHSGKNRRVKNMSIGWRLNEAYAAEMIKGYIKDGMTVSADLTDGSAESRKWWTRYAADYDYESKKGDTFAEVSISEQYMWVVRDGEVILESPIVSGTPGTPSATPTGGYYVFEMISPCTLSGMGWEVKVDYWMAFNFDIGFHDAYWQESFGGETYFENGSHGCVNLPHYAAEALYSIAYLNMPVYVY